MCRDLSGGETVTAASALGDGALGQLGKHLPDYRLKREWDDSVAGTNRADKHHGRRNSLRARIPSSVREGTVRSSLGDVPHFQAPRAALRINVRSRSQEMIFWHHLDQGVCEPGDVIAPGNRCRLVGGGQCE